MVSITHSIAITRPPSDVWAFISNYENDPLWRAGVTDMRQTPRPPSQVGTATEEVMQFWGRGVVTHAEVTAYENGQRIAFRSTSGPVPASGYRLVEHHDDQTIFTYRLDLEPRGWYRMLAPMLAQNLRRSVPHDLDRLKVILETA